MLTIELLGSPTLRRADGATPTPRDRKTWALLAYLALSEAPPTRQRLAELLFPRAADPLAGVRWSLAQLRQLLGDGAAVEDDPVRLRLPAGSTVDVRVLLHGRWSEAVALPLQCDLLEGLTFDSAPAFELWLTGARRRLRATAASVLREGALATLARDPDGAVVLAQRLVDVDPYDENHHVVLVRSLASAGRRAEAEGRAQECAQFLERELGVRPSRAVQEALSSARVTSPAWTATRGSVRAQLEAGEAAVAAGSWGPGLDHLRQAVADARRVGDDTLLARCLVALGGALVHAARGHDEEGSAALHEGGELAGRCGSDGLAATAWRELAWVEFLRARHERAERWLRLAAEAAGDDPLERAWIGLIGGASLSDVGDYPAAERELAAAVATADAAHLPHPAAFARSFLGRLHLLRGELAVAEEVLRCAVAGARDVGWTSMVPWPEALLAEVLLRRGDVDAADDLFDHAFAMGRQLGDPCWESVGARGLGLVAVQRGDLDRAIDLLEQAPGMCRRLPDTYLWIEAYALDALCDVAVAHGLPSAGRWIAQLEQLASRGGYGELTARALHHRARRHEPGASEAAMATAESIANPDLHELLGPST